MPPPAETRPVLSDLERAVVALSMGDGRRTIAPRGGLAERLVGWLFGLRRALPLADPRLEALRRIAVLCRLEGSLGRSDLVAFLATGFTIDHYEAVCAMIGATPGIHKGADA